jgi:hypothetical protein
MQNDVSANTLPLGSSDKFEKGCLHFLLKMISSPTPLRTVLEPWITLYIYSHMFKMSIGSRIQNPNTVRWEANGHLHLRSLHDQHVGIINSKEFYIHWQAVLSGLMFTPFHEKKINHKLKSHNSRQTHTAPIQNACKISTHFIYLKGHSERKNLYNLFRLFR